MLYKNNGFYGIFYFYNLFSLNERIYILKFFNSLNRQNIFKVQKLKVFYTAIFQYYGLKYCWDIAGIIFSLMVRNYEGHQIKFQLHIRCMCIYIYIYYNFVNGIFSGFRKYSNEGKKIKTTKVTYCKIINSVKELNGTLENKTLPLRIKWC